MHSSDKAAEADGVATEVASAVAEAVVVEVGLVLLDKLVVLSSRVAHWVLLSGLRSSVLLHWDELLWAVCVFQGVP